MHFMKSKNVILKLKNKKKLELPCNAINLFETELGHLQIADNNSPCVFIVKHAHLNTLVNMSKLNHHILLYFNKDKMFDGANFNTTGNEQPFYILSQAKYIILLPEGFKIKLNEIISIKI